MKYIKGTLNINIMVKKHIKYNEHLDNTNVANSVLNEDNINNVLCNKDNNLIHTSFMDSSTDNDLNNINKITTVDLNNTIYDEINSISKLLLNFKTQIILIQQKVNNLEKNIKKQSKKYEKVILKNKNRGNKNPSGFAKPSNVTEELCKFMNKEEGTKIARTDVTQALISYIKENNLQNKENKKFISPDENLKNLLGITENEKLTYFNIQKYMNKHFYKENNE